jgi:hypothetical protein
MRGLFVASTFLLASMLTGCVGDARIAMPGDLQSNTEELKLTGLGGWQDGHFRLGASEGRFSRRATQTTVFDTFVRNAGRGSFEVAGPELGGKAAGRCGFEERAIDTGVVVVPNGRLTYNCRFELNGTPVAGGLMLAEVPKGSGVLAGRTRAGELRLGQLAVGIQPIHHARSGGLPTGTPLGYAFHVAGRQIGAVDLNGTNKTIYAPRQPGPEHDAVLLASLALSVFWDPGA